MKRVLLLHQELASRPFRAKFNAAFIDAVRSRDASSIDIYEEAIESERFPGAEQLDVVREYLSGKYEGRAIDVIVVVGVKALEFARQNRQMFGNPAIVAALPGLAGIDETNDRITGLQGSAWMTATVKLALALRPATRHVFVVDGARDNTGQLQAEVERQWDRRRGGPSLTYLRDLPLTDLLSRLAAVPDNSVVLFVRQTMRNRAQDLDPLEGVTRVVRASPVPVFAQMEEFMGHGVLGGHMWRFEEDARRMAAMVRRIANGVRADDIPLESSSYATLIDWQQLQRWRIPEARLPAGSVVLYRRESLLEHYRWYVIGGLLVFAAQLALIAGLLVHRAQRRRAEEASRSSEARYRSVVDTQSELICRFLPDSTLTFVNDAYCRFSNRTREELLGRRFMELIPPQAREEVVARIGRLTEGVDSLEHPVTLADGTIGWHHWVNQAIVDGQGRLVEIQGVGRDITDRRRAEEALGRLEARNSAILRAIPDLMFMLERDGTYVDYHARDSTLLYAPPDWFVGRTIRDVLPPDVAEVLMDAVERTYLSDAPVLVEYELITDEPRTYEARLVRADYDRVLTIVRDVTEAKRARQRNRDLAGRLITSQEGERTRIARDLHDGVCQDVASLTVDISYLRQSRASVLNNETQDALRSLERRAAGIAEALRLLSHGLHPSVLHHVGLVAALQAHCAEVERQHHLQVHFVANGDVEPASQLVALSVFRITQEALSNTIRHGHAHHATVSLVRGASDLSLSIADDGRGFDLHAVRQNGGLGLVSIEERARLVQGQVTIRTRSGHGTSIAVRVPLNVRDHASQMPDGGRKHDGVPLN